MKTIIRENTWLKKGIPGIPAIPGFSMDFGWGNGYVLLPIGHPSHGKDYNYIDVDVHCGLTYGRIVDQDMIDTWEDINQEDLGMYCIGFDTAHYQDTLLMWPKEAVQAETDNLAKQLEVCYWN